MSPRAGDLNNDGLMDLVFGVSRDTVFDVSNGLAIYFQNPNGTVTQFGVLHTDDKNRPSPELCDFNGDGLLDIVAAHHSKIPYDANGAGTFLKREIRIYYNKGTKEVPIFNREGYDSLYIDGKVTSFEYCNIFFADVNNDNKKDLLFFKGKTPERATFHYSLNVSSNDSIVLGPVSDIKYNGKSLIANSLSGNEVGNKLSLSYFDTDSDGKKEFYFNTDKSYQKYFIFEAVGVESGLHKQNVQLPQLKHVGNKVILNNMISNSDLSLIDLKGRVIDTRVITGDGNKEIDLENLSSGNYFLRLKNSNSSQMFRLLKTE